MSRLALLSLLLFAAPGCCFMVPAGSSQSQAPGSSQPTDQPATNPATNPLTNPGTRPAATTNASLDGKTFAAVRDHAWWGKKMTDKEVNALVDYVVSMDSDEAIVVTDRGELRKQRIAGDPPQQGRSFMIWLDSTRYSRRLTRPEALSLLRRHLDQIEFQEGPARRP
jgi:hypothetical protein